jgi:ABC-type transport system involved in multi-copper enzyme maturation permease subunit
VKFREIFRFEFVYQVRSAGFWLYFAIFFAAGCLLQRNLVNSPFEIAQDTILTSLLWTLIAPAVAGNAAARDAQTRMQPLLYTAPIGKADYLGGRFLAAFLLNALILLAVPLGLLAALLLPDAPPAIVPFRPAAYLSAYCVLALPTAFVFTAVQFSVAALKRRPILSYLGSVLFFVAVSVCTGVVTNVLQMPALGKLLDPSCRMILLLSDTWTPLEKNTVLLGLSRTVLANRLLWLCLASAVLVFTHNGFRLRDRAA